MGISPPSPLPNSRGGSLQTCATGKCKHGLVIHLHTAKLHPIPCAFIEQRAHQHHDGWCTQHGCLQLASLAADMQTVAAQGQGSVPRGLKWGTSGPTVHFLRAAPWDPAAPGEPF